MEGRRDAITRAEQRAELWLGAGALRPATVFLPATVGPEGAFALEEAMAAVLARLPGCEDAPWLRCPDECAELATC